MKKDIKGLLCIWLTAALIASCFFAGTVLAVEEPLIVPMVNYKGDSIDEALTLTEESVAWPELDADSEWYLRGYDTESSDSFWKSYETLSEGEGSLWQTISDGAWDSYALVQIPWEKDETQTAESGVSTYKISTAEDLYALSILAGKDFCDYFQYAYILQGDINLQDLDADKTDDAPYLWTPIGTDASTPFCGLFNGNGYTVSGLYVDVTDDYASGGLFGTVGGTDCAIKNVNVSGTVQMSGEGLCAGILAGTANCPVTNCGVLAGSSVTLTGDYPTAGGIVGSASGAEIINCFSQAEVTSAGDGGVAGGICGSVYKAYNCYTTENTWGEANVSGSATAYIYTKNTEGKFVDETDTLVGTSADPALMSTTPEPGSAEALLGALNGYVNENNTENNLANWRIHESRNEGLPFLNLRPLIFTAAFETNGGSTIDNQAVTENEKVTKPEDPTKEDYAFKDWYADSGLITPYDFETPVINDVTIYAAWDKVFTVTFDTDGGNDVESQDVVSGEKATKPSNPTKTGYSFNGWYNGDTAYDFDTPVSADLTLTAKWSKKTTSRPTNPSSGSSSRYYMITFDSNGGSAVDGQNIRRNSLVEKPEDPTKEGFTFSGWYTDEELTALYDFEKAVQYGFALYAKWTQETETASDTTPYKDVKPNDWFYEDVKFVIEKDLIDGITDSEFGPNVGITRAALVTALYRAEGKPEVTGDYTFEDIPNAASYKDAIVWGQENGIIFGYSETEFCPEQTIIREQIAAIINRYAAYKKYDLSKAENVNILSYADAEEISGYAVPSVQYVVGAGVMEGKTDDTFNPKDDTTRAEMAAILRRFFKLHA